MKIKIESPQVLLSEGEGFAVRPADIYIEEDKIISVGENVTDFVPDRTIDGTDKLVIPGLINMHTHNYMTVFRNLADDVSFNEWLFERVMPREDKMTPEDAYLGATLGIMEMLRSGTTCFNDMQMHIHQTVSVPPSDAACPAMRTKRAARCAFVRRWKRWKPGRMSRC